MNEYNLIVDELRTKCDLQYPITPQCDLRQYLYILLAHLIYITLPSNIICLKT